MYLGLGVGIATGQIDFFSFYYEELTLFNYIRVSPSILRIVLLIIAIIPHCKNKKIIMNNKKYSITFVILYTIVFDILENNISIFNAFDNREFLVIYNVLLIIVYTTVSIRLL